jgi:integrase
MLNNAAVKAARPRPAAYKVADGDGLVLNIAPTGTKSWRLRFRLGGCEQTLSLGQWPEISLDAARARRDTARAAIARGEDPRQLDVETFEAAARAWHAHQAEGWSDVHAGDVLASLERDAFPAIGAIALDSVTRPMVLELLKAVERRGAAETARRLRQRIEGVFAFARAKGWCSIDNPADVGEALAALRITTRQPAIVDIGELRELLADIDALEASPIGKLAARFLALTAVRSAAVIGVRWEEIEDLDGPEPMWRVPSDRMKLGVARKRDRANDHLVPLAPAAVAVLRAARRESVANQERCARARVFAIGDGAIGELHARAGYGDRHVPHGWRAAFSTILNEAYPGDRQAIDRALAHQPGDMTKVEGAYNRAQFLERRRFLFEHWAQLLTSH